MLRFLDIFFIWDHGIEALKKFFELANSFHPTIKFTFEYSLTKINFLDVAILKNENRLETDLYTKPTDAHQYLYWTSCHPPHIRTNLPYSLAYRLRRICSTETYFNTRLTELRDFLLSRNYKSKTIDSAFQKVRNIPRQTAMKRRPKKNQNDRVPLVTTFNPGLPNLHDIVRRNFHILTESDRCREAIPEIPMIAYRRPKNIRDDIVRAKISRPNLKPKGFFKCNDKRCATCKFTDNTDFVTCNRTLKNYQILHHITCKTKNVIYLITCKRCSKQYIGKTDQPFHKRFNGTRSDITKKNDNKNNPVTRHFKTNNHTLSDIHVTPFDVIPFADTHTLKNKESFWIKIFQTVAPNGINAHKQQVYPIARFP